jgi:2-oxoglutarate dehydrogenase E1 component
MAASPMEHLAQGSFQPVLDDPQRKDEAESVTRLVLCSGKLGVELDSSPTRAEAIATAVARVELLAPFPADALAGVISRYPRLKEIIWAQEEPRNMGAWTYMEPRLRDLLSAMERSLPVLYVGRPERASPAEGSPERHAAEQARITRTALSGDVLGVAANGRRRGRDARPNGAARTVGRAKTTRASTSGRQ